MSKLDDILKTLQSEGATDDLSHDWETDLSEAKQQIKDLFIDLLGPGIDVDGTQVVSIEAVKERIGEL